MFFDWLAREGWMIFNWWLLATVAGAAALPLCLRLLHALPDGGYTLARAAGVLLTGFIFWLLNSFGLLRNDSGGIALAWLAVLGASIYAQTRGAALDWRGWWRHNRWVVLVAEVLFIVLLVSWATYRAYQHDLNGTEKPMDLAFLSSAMHSPLYPPTDPWLSGFAISYYYFGYVLGGMFATASGVVSTVAYNLWTAMLFALTGLTTFGVVCNLVRSRFLPPADATSPAPGGLRAGITTGLFGVVLLLLAGNYQAALVEIPYQTRTASAEYLAFWDVNLRQNPLPPFRACPEGEVCPPPDWSIDYFRAARTLNDRNLPAMVENGASERVEVINEFPMFSFVLADNHPHVMALPFTLLVIGLALNTLLSPHAPNREQIALYGVCLGGLVFLNTWDSPVYMLLLVSADLLRRLLHTGRLVTDDWLEAFILLLALLAITFIAYLPFIIGFSSQLGGVLPNVIHPTPLQQYALAFGALLPITLLYLLVEAWRGALERRLQARMGLLAAGGMLLVLLVVMGVFVLIGAQIPEARNEAQRFIESAGGWSAFLPEVLAKRFSHLGTTLLLLLMIALAAARLYVPPRPPEDDRPAAPYPPATGFALLMIAGAAALTLMPDYVYLRDNFAHRMNTVFKFYYIGWTLYAVAGAYGVYSLLADTRLRLPAPPVRATLAGVTTLALASGLLYPLLAIDVRANRGGTRISLNEQPAVTLDGWRTILTADDYEALMCLKQLVEQRGRVGVVALEAASPGSYDFFLNSAPLGSGRVSALTGIPTVLGWQGHQSQWRGRGFTAAVGTRLDDVRRLYEDLRMEIAADVIRRYGITYIVYGPVERERYGSGGEQKFLETFDIVCESGSSRVFRTRPIITGASVDSTG